MLLYLFYICSPRPLPCLLPSFGFFFKSIFQNISRIQPLLTTPTAAVPPRPSPPSSGWGSGLLTHLPASVLPPTPRPPPAICSLSSSQVSLLALSASSPPYKACLGSWLEWALSEVLRGRSRPGGLTQCCPAAPCSVCVRHVTTRRSSDSTEPLPPLPRLDLLTLPCTWLTSSTPLFQNHFFRDVCRDHASPSTCSWPCPVLS